MFLDQIQDICISQAPCLYLGRCRDNLGASKGGSSGCSSGSNIVVRAILKLSEWCQLAPTTVLESIVWEDKLLAHPFTGLHVP